MQKQQPEEEVTQPIFQIQEQLGDSDIRSSHQYAKLRKARQLKYLQNRGGKVTLKLQKFRQEFDSATTYIAVSEDGFKMAIQYGGGWVIINSRGKVLKSGSTLPNNKNGADDLIYIKKCRSFFVHEDIKKEIWKISTDTFQPELWMTGVKTGTYGGRQIREALNGKAMVIHTSKSEVTLVEIQEDGSKGKEATFDLQTESSAQIEVGGKNGEILIVLDKNRREIVSSKINEDLTIQVTCRFELSSVLKREDNAWTMALSPCGQYVFVHSWNSSTRATKQLMASIDGADVKICAVLDHSSDDLIYFNRSFAYLKTVEDDLIFKGITSIGSSSQKVITFVYNKVTESLKELKSHREIVADSCFTKLTRQGDTLYGIGKENGRLLEIN